MAPRNSKLNDPVCRLFADSNFVTVCRRRQLYEKDPINNIKLSSFLKDNLNQGLAVNGEDFKAAMARMDPMLIAELQKALT